MIRTHPAGFVEEESEVLNLTPKDVLAFDPINAVIPSCTQADWDVAAKILRIPSLCRLRDFCEAFQGEVNETTDGKKGFISKNPDDGPQILRGSTICLYTIREQSQGEDIYLRMDDYLLGKSDSQKAWHHKQERVGWQESSPQNNFRRIIAAPIPKNHFCNHKINYVPAPSSTVPLNLLLTILNSNIADWFFRLGSTNAAVSHYQIYNLPCPTLVERPEEKWKKHIKAKDWSSLKTLLVENLEVPGEMSQWVSVVLCELCWHIRKIEGARVLRNRQERSRLDPQSQPIQDVIDSVLFKCYGLSEEDGEYIRTRLGEML